MAACLVRETQAGGGKAKRFRSLEGGADACERGYQTFWTRGHKKKTASLRLQVLREMAAAVPLPEAQPRQHWTRSAASPAEDHAPCPRAGPFPLAAPAAQVPGQVPQPALPRSPGLAEPKDCQLPVPGTMSLGPCPVLCHQLSPCTSVLPSCAAQTIVGSTPVARGPRW